MHTRPAAALVAALFLVVAVSPLAHGALPCIAETLPCPFEMEGGEVGPGETRTVSGPASLNEPIEVLGRLVLQGAQLFVANELPGINVHPGGELVILGSVLDTQDGEPGNYVIRILPGGSLELSQSVLRNGRGVVTESNLTRFEDSVILDGPMGIDFVNVTGRALRMTFETDVGVNVTGGEVDVEGSRFSGATLAMSFVDAAGEIVNCVVASSANGVRAENSVMSIRLNSFDDRADPAGRGIAMSGSVGEVVGNVLSKWGTGIDLRDTEAQITGNTLAGNIVYGIFADDADVTITENTVAGSVQSGAYIINAPNATIENNVFRDSTYWQLLLVNAPDASVRNNTFSGGLYFGFAGTAVPRIRLEDNTASSTVLYMLYVEAADNAVIRRNTAAAGGAGIVVTGSSATLEDNVVTGAVFAGYAIASYDPNGQIQLHRDRTSTGTGRGFEIGGYNVSGVDLAANGHQTGFQLDAYASGTPLRIDGLNASDNDYGVIIEGSGAYDLVDLRAYDNEVHGVHVGPYASSVLLRNAAFGGNEWFAVNASADLLISVNATMSWWGSASGPSGAGPGTGDAVTTNVQFEPWLTSRPE